MKRLALLLTVLAAPLGAETTAPSVTPSPGLSLWLAGQPGPEAALDAIIAMMSEVDQSNGLRPERLEADMEVLTGDIVSEATERVMRTDVDDDGTVTFAEFDAMNPRLDDATLRSTFAPYDLDADGRTDREAIAAGERATVGARLDASPLRDVAQWDTDGDGVAQAADIQTVLAQLPNTVWAD